MGAGFFIVIPATPNGIIIDESSVGKAGIQILFIRVYLCLSVVNILYTLRSTLGVYPSGTKRCIQSHTD